jgi:hypothetical protein
MPPSPRTSPTPGLASILSEQSDRSRFLASGGDIAGVATEDGEGAGERLFRDDLEERGIQEARSTMSQGPKPVLPLRVGALLTVSPSLHVRVSARADALQIRAPFGDLTIPYGLIKRVTRVNDVRIRLDLAGATLRLDLPPSLPDMVVDYLISLLERGHTMHPAVDPRKTQHGHPRHG